jgi:hypothetical protein
MVNGGVRGWDPNNFSAVWGGQGGEVGFSTSKKRACLEISG